MQFIIFIVKSTKVNQTALLGALVLASDLLYPEFPKARLPQVEIALDWDYHFVRVGEVRLKPSANKTDRQLSFRRKIAVGHTGELTPLV